MKSTAKTTISNDRLLHSGSVLLNLAVSGKVKGAFPTGAYILVCGDSGSGKTFEVLTCLAEAANNPNFDEYRLIYDAPENGALMDIATFFGEGLQKRLEGPIRDENGEFQASSTVQEFYYNASDAIKAGPCIYILDSMDALSSDEADDKFEEQKEAHAKDKEISGTYGDGKAKANSQNIRILRNLCIANGSILFIICQTRDNIGFGAQFNPKTRAGGRALKFYADIEMWVSVRKTLTKKLAEKEREIGILSEVKITKNRVNGRKRNVQIPIYHTHGIDDVGACVAYLLEEGHWKKTVGRVHATEFDVSMYEEALIQWIEKEDKELELFRLVGHVWHDIENKLAATITRKPRYGQ